MRGSRGGVDHREEDSEGGTTWSRFCYNRLDLLASCTDEAGEKWAKRLCVTDDLNVRHTVTIPHGRGFGDSKGVCLANVRPDGVVAKGTDEHVVGVDGHCSKSPNWLNRNRG